MNNITTHIFPATGAQVRIADEHFIIADIGKALHHSNPTKLARENCDPDELMNVKLNNSRGRGNSAVTESGLYKMIMASEAPMAREFKDWIARDVLPAIRKDGMYVMGEEKVVTGEMSEDELIERAFTALKNKAERLTAITNKHIANIDIQSYCSLRREYASGSTKKKLSLAAKKLTLAEGLEVGKKQKKVNNPNYDGETYVNVYPFRLVHQAAEEMCCFEYDMDADILEMWAA